jgi:hypothetical protein
MTSLCEIEVGPLGHHQAQAGIVRVAVDHEDERERWEGDLHEPTPLASIGVDLDRWADHPPVGAVVEAEPEFDTRRHRLDRSVEDDAT